MRAPDGELVVPKVEEGMRAALAALRVLQFILRIKRNVAIDVPQRTDHELHGFVAERAAGIEPADIALSLRHLSRNFLRERLRFLFAHRESGIVRNRLAAAERNRLMRRILKRNRGNQSIRLDLFAIPADEADDDRFSGLCRQSQHLRGNLLGRRFADQRDDLGLGVVL
ncbi:hypothetical protein SDC9_110968 [bioreactor metagenome]|uniref:Uncharacterized protein n=1 Tax=bioreactor metagenome TaxID=1076179 RepID=A0A645BFG2_9ZZZZ